MGLVEAKVPWKFAGIVGLVSLISLIIHSVVVLNSHVLIRIAAYTPESILAKCTARVFALDLHAVSQYTVNPAATCRTRETLNQVDWPRIRTVSEIPNVVITAVG